MSVDINSVTSNSNTKSNSWFSSWFDTPFYHVLYKDRDYVEAQLFMDNITQYLNLPDDAKILDLACGKGRHSVYLNSLGYDVTGADLSENSIHEAKKFENETLRFEVHDMRLPFNQKFDAIFNLFTSFGYFDSDADNLKTLIAIKASISDYGFAVIDFMNVHHVLNNLVANEVKVVEGITFNIKRHHTDGHIVKEIAFDFENQSYHFTERVQAMTLVDFESLMELAEIYLLDIFGDYKLKKFHKTESERLILIFK